MREDFRQSKQDSSESQGAVCTNTVESKIQRQDFHVGMTLSLKTLSLTGGNVKEVKVGV